jgi:hypothetical protein
LTALREESAELLLRASEVFGVPGGPPRLRVMTISGFFSTMRSGL